MKHSRRAMASILLLGLHAGPLCCVTLPSDNPLRSVQDKVIDEQARSFLGDACRAGFSMAVVDTHAHTASFYNYGLASRAKGGLPTRTTLYEIASVTKTFTGTLAAMALHDRRLTLDGDFRRYLSDGYANLQFQGHPVTLRTLATHTSGMPRDIPDTDAIMNDRNGDDRAARLLAVEKGFVPGDFPAALARTTLRSEPGSTEQYSNAGMKVIAMGLERVYGTSFGVLLDQAILRPLRMDDTSFAVAPGQRDRLAIGYGPDRKPAPYHSINAGASWGLYSDTSDMARYVAWQLDESKPIVSQSHALIAGNPKDGKGMIWNLATQGNERMLFHGGGSFGMSSQVVLFPESGQGFVLLANDACAGTESALKAIAITVHAATQVPGHQSPPRGKAH